MRLLLDGSILSLVFAMYSALADWTPLPDNWIGFPAMESLVVKLNVSSDLERQLAQFYKNPDTGTSMLNAMSRTLAEATQLPVVVLSRTSGGEYVVGIDVETLHAKIADYLTEAGIGSVSTVPNESGNPFYISSYLLLDAIVKEDRFWTTLEALRKEQPVLAVDNYRVSAKQWVLAVKAESLTSIIKDTLSRHPCVQYVQRNRMLLPN